MSNVIYGQYDSKNYPLKRYYYSEIPEHIKLVLTNINEKELAVFRGGLAFIFLLNENQYILKDLDMLAYKRNENLLVQEISDADIVYINRNTFGETVITAFWENEGEYFKLDILLCDVIPAVFVCIYDREEKKTVPVSYIWRNRIQKIAEKGQRKHDDEKTLNHYEVAKKIGKYILDNGSEIDVEDSKVVARRLNDSCAVLKDLIDECKIDEFRAIQNEIIKAVKK